MTTVTMVLLFLIFALMFFAIGFGTGYGMRSLQSEWHRHNFNQRHQQ